MSKRDRDTDPCAATATAVDKRIQVSPKLGVAVGSVVGRWAQLKQLLDRPSDFASQTTGAPVKGITRIGGAKTIAALSSSKLLVIGAGGLGCDLLKCAALSGFTDIHVIDMDEIDATNLNRQFLFRDSDVGQPKANAAAKFINDRIEGVHVTPHYKKIQDFAEEFYEQFDVVVCGLDSVPARRWLNAMLASLLEYDEGEEEEDEGVVLDSVIPFVDAGTEGWMGHVKVVLPGVTACLECAIQTFLTTKAVPMCTLAATPRSAAHCIQWASFLAWDEEKPFTDAKGAPLKPDSDNPKHMQWLYEKAAARAKEFNLTGVTYKETLGVFKNIIPAIASTNALTSAMAMNEAFKLRTGVASVLNNNCLFNGTEGVSTNVQRMVRIEECTACRNVVASMRVDPSQTLQEFAQSLTQDSRFKLKSPGISLPLEDGRMKPVYHITGLRNFIEATRPNWEKPLREVLADGCELIVLDPTLKLELSIVIQFSPQ